MPSSNHLTQPVEWVEYRAEPKHIISIVFLIGLGLAAVAVGIGFVGIGKPGGLKYAVLFGLIFLLTAAHAYLLRVRPQHRHDDISIIQNEGAPAIELRYSGRLFTILVALMTCITVIFVLAAAEFFLTSNEATQSTVGASVSCALALFFGSFLFAVVTGKINRGKIMLSRQGVYQRGRAFSSFLPWEAIAGAKAAYNGKPEILVIAYSNAPWEKRQISKLWKLDNLPPAPMTEIDCVAFAINPNLVYHLVKFYVDDPAVRAELGTSASLERIRTGNFQ